MATTDAAFGEILAGPAVETAGLARAARALILTIGRLMPDPAPTS